MKTKIGLSAGAYAALTFLLSIYGGYTPVLIAIGFVLIVEKNEWLRNTVVKAGVLKLLFSIIATFLRAIPDILDWFNDFICMFGGYINYSKLSVVIRFLNDTLNIFETTLFLILALLALSMKTIRFSAVDNFISRHLAYKDEQ